MLNVIIADDNIKMVNGIKSMIDRNFPELYVEKTFYNGHTLMAYLDEHTPDILIVDILMPGYSGLDACSKIRETSSSAQIIIITGHTEFSYAQQAIRYQVCDLITKPYDNSTLKDAITKAVNAPVIPLINYYVDAVRNVSMRDFLKSYNSKLLTLTHGQLLFLLEEAKKILKLECNLSEIVTSEVKESLLRFSEQYYMFNPNASLTKRAKLFIRENYSDMNLSLTNIADYLSVSTSHLSRIFKSECHTGLTEYITKVRIEQAKRLLSETDFSIRDISIQTGYTTDKYFVQVFKDVVGITPSQYREVKSNEEN